MVIRDIINIKGCDANGCKIYSLPPETKIADAVDLMVKNEISSVVIMQNTRMVGLVTLREILVTLSSRGGDALKASLSDVMNREPIIGHPEDSIDYVRGVMTDNHISHLPVMEGDHLLDIISLHDVAKAAANACTFENTLLKRYIKNWPE